MRKIRILHRSGILSRAFLCLIEYACSSRSVEQRIWLSSFPAGYRFCCCFSSSAGIFLLSFFISPHCLSNGASTHFSSPFFFSPVRRNECGSGFSWLSEVLRLRREYGGSRQHHERRRSNSGQIVETKRDLVIRKKCETGY